MNFKPGDFFLGIVDFRGILVPGALLVYLEAPWIALIFNIFPLQSHWIVFAAAGYFLGHLLLAITELFNWLGKTFAQYVWPFSRIERDSEVLKERSFPVLKNSVAKNDQTNFHAALSFLRIWSAEAAGEVDRHMAGYKLLRCVSMVFVIDLLFSLRGSPVSRERVWSDVLLAVLFFLAFVRMLQWAHLLAYQYCILVQDKAKPPAPHP